MNYTDKGEKPAVGNYHGFHHIHLWVGNAYQAAVYYSARFGFKRVAFKGLTSKPRSSNVSTHVLRQGDITIALSSPMGDSFPEDMSVHLMRHGDGVRDVAFSVDDCRGIFKQAVERGATAVQQPTLLEDDKGSVWIASVRTYGDTVHSFVESANYKGVFLPGYDEVTEEDVFANFTPSPNLLWIDHCVGNQPERVMEPVAQWYEKVLQFHRFWSVDDSIMHTEYSALSSIVMADYSEKVKMPINEPAQGKKKSQIQEYVEFYGGSGVQHVAMRTNDIIHSVRQLRARGCTFLSVPHSYYEQLALKLEKSKVTVKEDLKILEELQILVDYDDNGYLLQLFTKPVEDRPTLFYEIIQRENHQGFGAGNFKALFESIEREQGKRGTLDNNSVYEVK
jgi:4-hydroxyphenylpyruvate dioxygenase